MNKVTLVLGLVGALFAGIFSKAHAQLVYPPQSSNVGYAYCFNPYTGQVINNCNVTLSNSYYFIPQLHNHNSPAPPTSNLSPTFGNTGTTGLPVNVTTTQVGQVEALQVCSNFCTITDIYVAYNDLVELVPSPTWWVLIGATTYHPINHFGTLSTIVGIQNVAAQYKFEYPSYDVIAINDISLPYGGIFDLNRNWAGPHYNHSRGKSVDIRGNGLPNSVVQISSVQQRFMQICQIRGATLVLHESQGTNNEHFHCQWP